MRPDPPVSFGGAGAIAERARDLKIWTGYGSEHSYRLVLIGRFADDAAARVAEEDLSRLQIVAQELPETDWRHADEVLPDNLAEALRELDIWYLTRPDVDNFNLSYSIERSGSTLRVTGDDADVQGFIKVFLERGGRIEIFSGHHWTEEGEARRGPEQQSESDAGAAAIAQLNIPAPLDPTDCCAAYLQASGAEVVDLKSGR